MPVKATITLEKEADYVYLLQVLDDAVEDGNFTGDISVMRNDAWDQMMYDKELGDLKETSDDSE